MNEIRHTLCNQYDYNVIGVTETWLTAATPSDASTLMAVVGIFVSNNLLCVPRMDLSLREIELLLVEVRAHQKRIIVGVCYRPPGQNRDEQNAFLMSLENSIENFKGVCPDLIVLLGDFNDKCINWNLPHTQSEI